MSDWERQIEKTLRCIPGYNPWDQAADSWLDHKAALHAINWFDENLKHVEGSSRGQPFMLRAWQAAIVGNLFGWKRKDEAGRIVRRYRKCFVKVGRGNGKTPLASGIVLYGFFEDNEPGAQCYLAAGQREQAGILFRNAKGMVDQNPRLRAKVKIFGGDQHRSIVLIDDPLSFCKVIPADAAGQHGNMPHITVVDELHVQESRDLLDVVETAMSKKTRSQPLLVMITTADFDRPSVCNEVDGEAHAVRDNKGKPLDVGYDPSFLPVLYELEQETDWQDEATWPQANPNLDISVSRESLRSTVRKAIESPGRQNAVKRLHFCMKTGTDVAWIDLGEWDKCGDPVDEDSLRGRACFGGLDLSEKNDLTAWVLLFPPTDDDELYRILPRFWVPDGEADVRERRDRVPYRTWIDMGLIYPIPGRRILQDYIFKKIQEDATAFAIQEIAFDTWNASGIAEDLDNDGAKMVKFGQGYASMSEPSKELEAIVLTRRLAHANNPVLRWMAGNTMVKTDPAGNIKPDKEKSRERIDGIVATVMALGRAMVTQPAGGLDIRVIDY